MLSFARTIWQLTLTMSCSCFCLHLKLNLNRFKKTHHIGWRLKFSPAEQYFFSPQFHVSIWIWFVRCRTFLQRVLSAHVESVSGVPGAENPEWSGNKLWEDGARPSSFRGYETHLFVIYSWLILLPHLNSFFFFFPFYKHPLSFQSLSSIKQLLHFIILSLHILVLTACPLSQFTTVILFCFHTLQIPLYPSLLKLFFCVKAASSVTVRVCADAPAEAQKSGTQPWHCCHKLIYVRPNPKTGVPIGHWPIPEAFWPDQNSPTLVNFWKDQQHKQACLPSPYVISFLFLNSARKGGHLKIACLITFDSQFLQLMIEQKRKS